MGYNIAVCDDSIEYGNIVTELIKEVLLKNNLKFNVRTFNLGSDLIQAFEKDDFKIVFLDMEMPDMNGIETGLRIRKFNDNTIIFYLTSHKDYAYDSYKVKARNYLLKPIRVDVLEKEILDCMDVLIEPVRFLDVKDTKGTIHRIPTDSITHIIRKKEDRKIHIYTLDKEETVIVQTLENMENMLSDCNFKRSSKSCLVNLDNIRAINKNVIYFSNDETEEASRRCLSELVNIVKQKTEV